MKKKSRLPVLLLTLAMVLTYMPAPAFADNGVKATEQRNRIVFNGDSDWMHLYNVDGKRGTLSLDDLNIKIIDGSGDETEPAEINIFRSWYDEEAERDIKEEASAPFGIAPADETEGFTEYVAEAKAADGTEGEGSFIIADKYSLNYVCSKVEIAGSYKDGWRMMDRFRISAEDFTAPVIKAADGKTLVEGTDYDITYYRRNGDIDESAPGKDRMDYLDTGNEFRLDGAPAEEGEYFFVIEGKSPYYGGNYVLLDLGEAGSVPARIGIDSDDDDLWENGTKEFTLDIPDEVSGAPKFYIIPDGDDWDNKFELKASDYIYNAAGGKLTLKGGNISAYFEDDCWMDIYVEISSGDELLARGQRGFGFRFCRYENDLPEEREMLPGWDETIDSLIYARACDANHPDWEDYDLEVKNVRIQSQTPARTVLELVKEGNSWKYTAKDFGEAAIEITYDDEVLGEGLQYVFNVYVADTVYKAEFEPADGYWEALPGASIELKGHAWKDYLVYDEEDADEYRHEGTDEGLAYRWDITDGEEFASVTQDKNDPSKAVVKFAALPKDKDGLWEQVNIKLSVFDENSDDKNIERASKEDDLAVSTEIYQIWPGTVDSSIDIGESVTVRPELRYYKYGRDGFETVKNVSFSAEIEDEEALELKTSGNSFTLRRLRDYGTGFRIKADFTNKGGDPDDREQWYNFDHKDYNLYFDQGEYEVYDDYELTLKPVKSEDLEGFAGFSSSDVEFGVGWFEDDSFIEADPSVYSIDQKNLSVTLYGAKMKEKGIGGTAVGVTLKIEGAEEKDNVCWVELREACGSHRWKESVKEATCTNAGSKTQVCENCGEVRETVIPAAGHKWDSGRITKAPSLSEEGVKTFTCAVCGETKTESIAKLSVQKLNVKAKTKTIKQKKLKKKAQSVKAITVSGAQGAVSYKGVGADKKSKKALKINASTGKISVKKKTRKGTYKMKVTVTAAGNDKFAPASKTITVKIKVK